MSLSIGDYLFFKGDFGEDFFIIFKGSIQILEEKEVLLTLNPLDYFILLNKLKKSSETNLLEKTINSNSESFPILFEDVKKFGFQGIYLRVKLGEFLKKSSNLNKFQISEYLESLDPNYENILNIMYNEFHSSKFMIYFLSLVNEIDLKSYKYIESNEKQVLKIYEYSKFITLTEGHIIGEFALERKNRRTATTQATENCILGKIHESIYHEYLKEEKQKFIQKEINFFIRNFIFREINDQNFKKFYFDNFFRKVEMKKSIIFKQNEVLTSLYFIREGELELNFTGHLLDLNNLIIFLHSKAKIETHDKFELNKIKKLENIEKKQKFKIMISGANHCLGLEEYYFNFPHNFTAVVNSEKCKFYQLDLNKLSSIINKENTLPNIIHQFAYRYLLTIINRLTEIYEFLCKKNLNESKIMQSPSKATFATIIQNPRKLEFDRGQDTIKRNNSSSLLEKIRNDIKTIKNMKTLEKIKTQESLSNLNKDMKNLKKDPKIKETHQIVNPIIVKRNNLIPLPWSFHSIQLKRKQEEKKNDNFKVRENFDLDLINDYISKSSRTKMKTKNSDGLLNSYETLQNIISEEKTHRIKLTNEERIEAIRLKGANNNKNPHYRSKSNGESLKFYYK